MRIIKEMSPFYRFSKHIDPLSPIGKFLTQLNSLINNEKEFISFISSIKFWDYQKISLWAFEDILNYIDEILNKYSYNTNDNDINNKILIPLLEFLYLLIKNNYTKEIVSSFDNLQIIYLTTFNAKIKGIIIGIHLLYIENKKNLIFIYKLFYKTLPISLDLKTILFDLINNNFKITQNITNLLEELLSNIHKKWINFVKIKKKKLTPDEQKSIQEISPMHLFKDIVSGKKNFKKLDNSKDKNYKEYNYFKKNLMNKFDYLEKMAPIENNLKYLIKEELNYIIKVNNFLFLVNEIVECSNDNKNINKIISLTKLILYSLNLFIKDNQHNFEEDTIVSESYIECYYNDVLKIVTSPKICIELKSVFLNAGISFMTTFDGYDNILFQNGLFHSFLNDLTHQNGNELEVMTLNDSNSQEFLKSVLNFVFNFTIFKEIPLNFLAKILEIPKNNVYPYRIDNVIFSLKKRKVFDENILNQLIIPRIKYELENLSLPLNEIKYLYQDDISTHDITINEKNILIDKLYQVLIRIIQRSTNLNSYGNFEQELAEVFKKVFTNKNILERKDLTPTVINSFYFFIKLCNSFPAKIPTYLKNNIFDIMISYFTNYFPKQHGSIHILFLMLYTISIHEEGKKYIKENNAKLKTLFGNIFKILQDDETYFYYNLFILKDLVKYELYSPYQALIHLDGISELIQIIFENLKTYIDYLKIKMKRLTIQKKNNISLDDKLFFFESQRHFVDEFLSSIKNKDLDSIEKLNIDISNILKAYLDIYINPISLYTLNFLYVNPKAILPLAKKEPLYILEHIYNQFKELMDSKNKLQLEQIQIDKIIATLQKIFEFIFGKIYQKVGNAVNFDKFTILYSKLVMFSITSKTKLLNYLSPIINRQITINSNNFYKYFPKIIPTQLRDLLIKYSYQRFIKDLPHTTNPKLNILDEDNYKDFKLPVQFNKIIKIEIPQDSNFMDELYNIESRINNYLQTSIDYFYSLGKMIKAKGLYEIKDEDVESVKNYMKLGYILKELIKTFHKKYEINEQMDEEERTNNILVLISLMNMINLLLFGKGGRIVASIVLFYFIRYGGLREALKIGKKFLFFCKNQIKKGELSVIELLIIKNFWNLLVFLFISLIKYSFFSNNGYFTILIREKDLTKQLKFGKELDLYAKYLLLNDFIEVFFEKDNDEYNVSILRDIEMTSEELTRAFYILIDICCREYSLYSIVNKDDMLDFNEICDKGFQIYEIIQVIQEDKKRKDEIIEQLNKYKNGGKDLQNNDKMNEINDDINNSKNNEKSNNEQINNDKKEKSEIKNSNNLNNSDNIYNDKNINNNSDNNNINNNDNVDDNNNNNNDNLIRIIEEGSENKSEKKLNEKLKDIEELPFKPDESFKKLLKEILGELNMSIEDEVMEKNKQEKNKNKKHRNEIYPYNKENYLNSLIFIGNIINNSPKSSLKKNEIKKMNIKYRIKEFQGKTELLENLNDIIEKINSNKNSDKLSKEEKYENELKYKTYMNYSILRYKTLNPDFYSKINPLDYGEFINKNNLIRNYLNSIKEIVDEVKNKKIYMNNNTMLNIINENILGTYIIFSFLNYYNKDYKEEKKLFLETFLLLLKSSNNSDNIFYINESILIFALQIIQIFYMDDQKEEESLNQYLFENNFLKYILDLKYNPEDSGSDFYENNFKFSITIDEAIKKFIYKILSEKTLDQNKIESIIKYALANLNLPNNEINLDDFLDLFSDFIRSVHNFALEEVIKKLFDIKQIEKKNEENKDDKEPKEFQYVLILKEEYHKDIEKIKNEINKGIYNDEKKEESKTKKSRRKESFNANKSSKKIKGKIAIEEKIKQTEKYISERNRSLFYTLLKHIWKTSSLINEDISKNKKYVKVSRNFIIDLDSSLSCLNSIIHGYPSFLSLLLQFQSGKKHKISFIKYLIKYVFPLLNYYHYCISLPAHINSNEDLMNKIVKEKKDALKNYNNKANSFQSFLESFRYINIITSLTHSLTYKRRNMDENENVLMDECRKKILNEINLILSEISSQKINDFNFILNDDDLYPKNVVSYKSCIIVLYSMTEFYENSDIYNQMNPFEISSLVYSKEYDILRNITNILKNMKIDEKVENFHEMGIKYLSQLLKYIRINKKKNIDEKSKNKDEKLNIATIKNDKVSKSEKKEVKNKIELENDEHEKSDENNNNNEQLINNNSNISNSIEKDSMGDSNLDFPFEDSGEISDKDDEVEEGELPEEDEEDEEEEDELDDENDMEGGEEEEEDYDDDELFQEQMFEENNSQEDLFSLMPSEDDDSELQDEDDNNNNNYNLQVNNLNLEIVRDEGNNDENSEIDNQVQLQAQEVLNRILNRNSSQDEDNIQGSENDYNEENILFYNPYETDIHSNKYIRKGDKISFYEEFITFPFLILKIKEKNNLKLFDKLDITIDIFCNLDKAFIDKIQNLFLYFYIFPFHINYQRYLNFVLIGTKEQTLTAYFKEINIIAKDFLSYYSSKSSEIVEEGAKKIKKNLLEDKNILKIQVVEKLEIKKPKDNIEEKNDNELLQEIPEELRDSVSKKLQGKDNGNDIIKEDKDNKENKMEEEDVKEEKNENNENNNNNNDNDNKVEIDNQFIKELPPDLRQNILLDLDPSLIPHLDPESRREYDNLMNSNREKVVVLDLPLYGNENQINNIVNQLKEEINKSNGHMENHQSGINLNKLKYRRDDIITYYYDSVMDEKFLTKIFEDKFIENVMIFNMKTIITLQKKDKYSFNEYNNLLNELILNENLRYKIIDLLLDMWICDFSCLTNLLKNNKISDKNSFLKSLYYLYVDRNLIEEYFFDDYEQFFLNFANKHQKDMKKYFLKTTYSDNGSYILREEENSKIKEKQFDITENSKNIKDILNLKYKTGENILSNLISLTLINSKSNFKANYSIKIFTKVIQNCLKNIKTDKDALNNKENNENENNNELNISKETIEKIIDLFNNFETTLFISKGQRSNNPTSLLIEMISDQKIYNILLDVVLKRITEIKETISKEMDDFFKNKKIDISVFNKLLPEIIVFKLIKLLSNINEHFTNQISEFEKSDSKKKKESKDKDKDKDNNDKNIQMKKDMQNKLKNFISKINDILFSCWEQLNNLLLGINKFIKDCQDITLPKLNRLIPYLETFITLSHLQFILKNPSRNSPDKNPFVFEQKFISGKENIQKGSIIPPPKSLNQKNETDNFVEYFCEFCEKNKKIINFILRQYPKMFPNEIIRKISSILDLENKQKYFRHCLKKLPSSHKYREIKVRRGPELFEDSYNSLSFIDAKDLRGKLMVSFENEEAVDAGGVKREWLTLLSKEMFNPNYMLFTLSKNGTTYTINSDSGKFNSEHLMHFEFIGKIMAKAIFDGMMLDCYFTRIIYKLISDTQISYHDMEDYDPVFYNSLKWLLENDFTNQETYLTYSYDHENLGEIQTVDLIENGRNIEVTEANKFDYIQKLCSSKLYDTIKSQIDSLLKGFYDIIPQKLISIFNHRELELVISGLPTIDIKDWKDNTIYENYNEESKIIKYFWEIIESFDNDERAEFLQFVTGSSKVPLEGFSALQGIGGINKFKISKVFDTNFDRLPTAHTCTNQLDLPDYPNKDILYERLTLAIREGKNSFGFV